MTDFTLEFLVVHEQFQDTISYSVAEEFSFEDVLHHICSSFGFDRQRANIKSALGFEIADANLTIRNLVAEYGHYFKLIVEESREIPHDNDVTTGYTDLRQKDEQEVFDDVLDDLIRINSENWSVDEKGEIELTILPNLGSFITQLHVKCSATDTAENFFLKIAKIFGLGIEDIIVASTTEEIRMLEKMGSSMLEVLEEMGAVLVLYHSSQKRKIEQRSQEISQQVRDLIFKYKRR